MTAITSTSTPSGTVDPVQILLETVRRPSPSGAEGEVAAYLVDVMARFCDEAFVDDAGNAVGRWGDGPLRITLLGHIDTVPGAIPVRIDEHGVLHGRGAVDAKGSFCAAVAAVARLPATLASRLRLRLIGAVGEESPGSPGARHALAAYETPDMVVVGEPSGWDAITFGYKGRAAVTVVATRPNVHTATDEATAFETVVDAFEDVRGFCRGWNAGHAQGERSLARFDALQLALLDVTGTNDGLRQEARAKLQFRLPPALPPDRLDAALRELDLGPDVELRFEGGEAAHRAPRSSRLAAAFRQSIRAHGGTPRHLVKTGTSDMNVVAPHWKVPMVAYGPGDATLDHTPDERVHLAEYARSVEVLAAALVTLAADGPTDAVDGAEPLPR
ncbi:MAG: [LysW]-lysine hydrolase [Trueperaceae bacterium]